jgi:hypothetical protein
MDLAAILSLDNTITIVRTLTWERISSKSGSELTTNGSNITTLSFSLSGKILGLGCDDGEILVFCIESSDCIPSLKANQYKDAPIEYLAWQYGDRLSSYDNTNNINENQSYKIWNHGGINLTARTGMEDYAESGYEESSYKAPEESFFSGAENSILISLNSEGILAGHIFGIFPIFSIDIASLMSSTVSILPILCQSIPTSLGIPISTNNGSIYMLDFNSIIGNRKYFWYEHLSTLYLMISSDLSRLHDMMISNGKKWKDSNKVMIPKLSLLQNCLNGYQMKMDPVQFMYTITHCGLWHPAALTSFSQHWNDQGLTRLRSAIDSTSKAIVKQLYLRGIPIATNTALRCLELLSVNEQITSIDNIDSIERKNIAKSTQNLVRASELLLYKLDETLNEAKMTRDAMLLYLQFIKECSIVSNATDSQQTKKIELTLMSKCRKIFDPRHVRALDKGPQGQAEYVTGTHLYAYLQDAPLSEALVKARRDANGFGNFEKPPRQNVSADIQTLFKETDYYSEQALKSNNDDDDDENKRLLYDKSIEAFSKRSLIQQIKAVKDVIQECIPLSHNSISSRIDIKKNSNLRNLLISNTIGGIICSNSMALNKLSICAQGDECDVTNIVLGVYCISRNNTIDIIVICSSIDSSSSYSACIGQVTDSNITNIDIYASSLTEDVPKVSIVGTIDDSNMNADSSCYLFSFSIDNINFTRLSSSTLSFETICNTMRKQNIDINSKNLSLRSVDHIKCCGARGVIVVCGNDNKKLLVIDMEADDDDDDDNDDGEGDGEGDEEGDDDMNED